MNKEQLVVLARSLQDDLSSMLRVFQEKGVKYFTRPLAIAGTVVFGVYWLVYQPSIMYLDRVNSQLAAAAATAQYMDRYKDLDNRLQMFYATLPRTKDRATWILDTVRQAMKDEGIYFTNLSPVEEHETGGFIVSSLTVGSHASYKEMASWIARMERSQYLLHVSSLQLSKDSSEIGMNTVTLTVTTMAPKEGGTL